jgi:hypothetical protein
VTACAQGEGRAEERVPGGDQEGTTSPLVVLMVRDGCCVAVFFIRCDVLIP